MTRDQFKLLHSETMLYLQCIEYDLKRIYSGMSSGDFDENMDLLETSNFGNTLKKLRHLDNSDGKPYLSAVDYDLLDQIREMRNYWCHQCYLDYVYIYDEYRRERQFQKIANRLYNEHNRIFKLHKNLEKFYFNEFE